MLARHVFRATGGKCGTSETSEPRERYPICRVARLSHVSRVTPY